MAERVTCIVRGDKDRYSVCRCITEIRTDARKYTRLEAHEKVKTSPGSIYVEAEGSRADLIPAVRDGLKYVRTAPNDTTTDNPLKVSLVPHHFFSPVFVFLADFAFLSRFRTIISTGIGQL